jgi:hypothetical protein
MTGEQRCGSGSGIRRLFGPWVRDRGWVKNQDPNPGSGSGMEKIQIRDPG